MCFRGIVGLLAETRRESQELSVIWQVNNFLSLSNAYEEYYDSPDFEFGNAHWCLKMYPNGDRFDGSSGYLDLCIERKDEDEDRDEDVTVQFTISIEGTDGVGKRKEDTYQFQKDDMWTALKFLPRHLLWDHQSILIPHDMMTISCKMKLVAPTPARDASNPFDEELKEAKEKGHSSEKQGIEKVVEDFGRLLISCENSDVTVQVCDRVFSVHKAILSARCPVFSAMFQHPTIEKASNIINIEDCEPDIFRVFLQYLYTGSVQPLTDQNVFNLYILADKYLAGDLKLECLKHIQKTLSAQTFCSAVKFALKHSENDLYQVAIDFASKKISLILRSVEWQNFMCDYPREANEILIKCFGSQS